VKHDIIRKVFVQVTTSNLKFMLCMLILCCYNYTILSWHSMHSIYLKMFLLSTLFYIENDVGIILSKSCTPGTAGHRLWHNKSRYDPVPSSDKQLGNQILHIGYGPTAPSWRGANTNLKELNSGTIYTNPFNTSLHGRGRTGFCHLSSWSNSTLCPGSVHARAPGSHAWGLPVPGKWPKSRDPWVARPFNAK
jgi:hypothetical protein